MNDLLHTFLDLGDATSRNLDFAHKSNYQVSFGEETITETNLLELLRRHPDIIHVETFTKRKEGQNGADWEWTLLGKKHQYSMRVQAKRIQKNGALKINHAVGKLKLQQIDLLLKDAKVNNLDAFYCIYCSEKDRTVWTIPAIRDSSQRMSEYGCLLVDAHTVKSMSPKKLSDIERECFPWHFLTFDDALRISYNKKTYTGLQRGLFLKFRSGGGFGNGIFVGNPNGQERRNGLPTIDFLNGFSEQEFDRTGLTKANPDEAFRARTVEERADYGTRRVSKRLVLDVRNFESRRS